MQQFNCLIVEDEPLAAEILEDYIDQVPFLRLIAKCNNAINALELLQIEKIDLIFLDINLPKLKGLDFIQILKDPVRIIIITAYPDYALQGFELNVIDYLLKPVDFNRFLQAVNKVRHVPGNEQQPVISDPHSERAFVFFSVSKRKVKIFLDEILYIESEKEYVKVITKDKTILTKFQLGEIENIFDKKSFVRVHRSFIVAKDKIDAFSSTDIEINGHQIPIGRSYKELIIGALEL